MRRSSSAVTKHLPPERGGQVLTIEPVSPGIGAVIHGVDMAGPTDAQVEQVWRMLMDRKVVFFRTRRSGFG